MSDNKETAGAQGAQHESLIDIPRWVFDDGGRAAAGFKGEAGDCVTRAIAIASRKSYAEVYEALHEAAADYRFDHDNRITRYLEVRGTSPRNGVHKPVYVAYLAALGWQWTPTMRIGSGCEVHLRADELPAGRLVVSVSKHLVAVIDGVIHDTHDCSRLGTRCVYGFWTAPEARP
jgi:hypothetical protein